MKKKIYNGIVFVFLLILGTFTLLPALAISKVILWYDNAFNKLADFLYNLYD